MGTYWLWESTATLRTAGAVGSVAWGTSAPTEEGEGRGHIAVASAQLVSSWKALTAHHQSTDHHSGVIYDRPQLITSTKDYAFAFMCLSLSDCTTVMDLQLKLNWNVPVSSLPSPPSFCFCRKGSGGALKLPHWVWVEPGRQTFSAAFWAENPASGVHTMAKLTANSHRLVWNEAQSNQKSSGMPFRSPKSLPERCSGPVQSQTVSAGG